jgi:hypothetical protein
MAKMITDIELSEIITLLLSDETPIEESVQYSEFMTEIAGVITKYCGGEILYPANCVADDGWMIGVHDNDSVPSDGGVWAKYDTDVEFEGAKE